MSRLARSCAAAAALALGTCTPTGETPPAPGPIIPTAAPTPTRVADPPKPTATPVLVPVGGPPVSSAALALGSLDGDPVAAVADADERQLVLVDLTRGLVVSSIAVEGRPEHVIIDRAGRLYVSERDAATVSGFEVGCVPKAAGCPPMLKPRGRWPTAPEPTALALTDRGQTLLVSCGWGHVVQAHPVRPGGASYSIPVGRQPRGIAVDHGSERAYVAHAVGSRVSVVSLRDRVVEHERALHWRDDVAIDGEPIGNVPRFAVQAHAIALADDDALVPMVLAYPGEPAAQANGYGASVEGFEPFFPHEPVLVAVELSSGLHHARLRLRHEVLSADSERARETTRRYKNGRPPCLLPRSVVVDLDRAQILIACQDTGHVVAVGLDAEQPLEASEQARWAVGGGPTAVRIDSAREQAWVWAAFDRTLHRLSLRPADADIRARTITIAGAEFPEDAGRRAFHTPSAFDGRSCASCHIDGRDDGLSWQSPRGMVQTPILAGRATKTPPFGWHGEHSTIEQHIRRTFKRLRARPPDPQTVAALSHYIATMPTYSAPEPVPAPAPVPVPAPAPDPQRARGRALFFDPTVGCAHCHEHGDGSDGNTHRIGRRRGLNTPSLRFIGDTAPYMHDGRYETLRALLAGTDGTMGSTSHLDEADMTALVAYLRGL